MAVKLGKHLFGYWLELLQNMWEGHQNSGTPLRADLAKEVEAANKAFPGLVNTFYTLKSDERRARQQTAETQERGRSASIAVGHSLASLKPEQPDTVKALYQVADDPPTRRLEVLAHLQHIVRVAAEQTDESMKPEAEVLAEVTTQAQALRQKIDTITDVKADLENTRIELSKVIPEYRELRKRVYAYLVTRLEQGYNDPVMMEYGLRRKFNHGSRTVTVVDETEPVVNPEPAPSQP